jgi:hypothetical protein
MCVRAPARARVLYNVCRCRCIGIGRVTRHSTRVHIGRSLQVVSPRSIRRRAHNNTERVYEYTGIRVLTPVSDIKALAHLLRQGELLRLREPQKWILRPIWGLGRDRYVFASYHPCWLVTTPEVLISGHIVVGVIFSGRKGGYL